MQNKKTRFNPFSGLRWKLALSYVGVTLGTVLALEVIVLVAIGVGGKKVSDLWLTYATREDTRLLAQMVAAPLEVGNVEQLTQILYQPVGLAFQIGLVDTGTATPIVNTVRVAVALDGTVIASNRPSQYLAGQRFQEPDWLDVEKLVQQGLAEGNMGLRQTKKIGNFAAVAPIVGRHGALLGILYYRQAGSNFNWSPMQLALPLAGTTVVLLPCMVPLGLIFGFVTATGFTRRLFRLTSASTALANGHWDQRVPDASNDEIGRLAQQFNRMADQLEADTTQLRALAESNARLAALDVRHRLARDLHDGIKQNLFGINLAISTAINLLETDASLARTKLTEAKEQNHQAQAEMQALLDELGPAGLDEYGLVGALNRHLDVFERQQGLQINRQIGEMPILPPKYEQALYRVAQEALGNVARHAHASQVRVALTATPTAIILQIEDNGQGFAPEVVAEEKSRGLRGMRERLAELNGTLTITTTPGAGVRLTASLPVPPVRG
jgi:signal transduction histidine kinase